jgi:hypothetical protein
MSTPQTDAHWAGQEEVVKEFANLIIDWQEGAVTFDTVQVELEEMVDDEKVSEHTFNTCKKLWLKAQADEDDEWDYDRAKDETL